MKTAPLRWGRQTALVGSFSVNFYHPPRNPNHLSSHYWHDDFVWLLRMLKRPCPPLVPFGCGGDDEFWLSSLDGNLFSGYEVYRIADTLPDFDALADVVRLVHAPPPVTLGAHRRRSLRRFLVPRGDGAWIPTPGTDPSVFPVSATRPFLDRVAAVIEACEDVSASERDLPPQFRPEFKFRVQRVDAALLDMRKMHNRLARCGPSALGLFDNAVEWKRPDLHVQYDDPNIVEGVYYPNGVPFNV